MASTALQKLVRGLTTKRAGERDLYPDLKALLTRSHFGIGLQADQIVVDAPSLGGRLAPDLAIFLRAEDGSALRGPDHAYAIIEAKPEHPLGRPASRQRIFDEKRAYVQTGTRWFYLVDQERVLRYEAPALDTPVEWLWSDLEQPGPLRDCFGVIDAQSTGLVSILSAFRAHGSGHASLNAEGAGRRDFVDTIRACLTVTSEMVRAAIDRLTVPALREANAAVESLASEWGEAHYQAGRTPLPFTFDRAIANGRNRLSDDELRQFLTVEALSAAELEERLYALEIEHELLPFYAQRLGLDTGDRAKRPSLLKPRQSSGKTTASGRAIETFAYETAVLLVSRMLMIRFAEDNGFLPKLISNGGVEAFHAFDAYGGVGHQALLQSSYSRARPIYGGLFSPSPLDWLLRVADPAVDQALVHALWLLNRWNFATVDGDVLSGVYDKYLDPARRRALGEVFTRPEVARYLLDRATEGHSDPSILDPSCGSGTFIVERLSQEVASLRDRHLLTLDTVGPVLDRLAGLDINPFSATLARMQMLWHLLDAVRNLPPAELPSAVRALVRRIRVEGGHTSLDPFSSSQMRQGSLDLSFTTTEGSTRSTATGLFRSIATGQYDAVVGNPPFVRAQRLGIPDTIRHAYADVLQGEADIYVAFVKRALETWVKPGGRMAFILPIPATVAGYAAGLRRLVERHRIVELIDFEPMRRVMFRGVKRPVIALIVEKNEPADDDTVILRVLDASCYDETSDAVLMSGASTTVITRADFLGLYAPTDFDEDDAEDEGEMANEDTAEAA